MPTNARRSNASRASSGLVVLLVDDDPGIRAMLRRALERRSGGFVVREASSAMGARRILEAEIVDVICSDLKMPGQDGHELLAEVGERWPGTRRLMLSAFATADMVAESPYEVLRKPVSVRAVVDALVRLARQAA